MIFLSLFPPLVGFSLAGRLGAIIPALYATWHCPAFHLTLILTSDWTGEPLQWCHHHRAGSGDTDYMVFNLKAKEVKC